MIRESEEVGNFIFYGRGNERHRMAGGCDMKQVVFPSPQDFAGKETKACVAGVILEEGNRHPLVGIMTK